MAAKKNKEEFALVYSSERGRICPGCSQPVGDCNCKQVEETKKQGVVRIGLSTKGRKGNPVTVVSGVMLKKNELDALGKDLRKHCGTGGTVKDGDIEIQGDNREKLRQKLSSLGYKLKVV